MDGLVDLYARGLVKGIGLSNYGPKRLKYVHKKFSDRGVPIATLQIQYSLLSTYPVTQLGLKNVGDESVEQAHDNIGALGWQLDSNEIAELDRIVASLDKKMVQNIFQTQ